VAGAHRRGGLMGALSDLLQRAGTAANPANPANLGIGAAGYSQESQDSQGVEPEIRAHLLSLAEAECVDAAHVHRLTGEDIAACEGLDDSGLRAYLRALVTAAMMDAGEAPAGYSHAVQCDGCGPVWLWPEAPERVKACPWCFRRKAGKRIPRPQVTCGGCRHYLPDALNAEDGMGGCALGPGRAYWPMRRHTCGDMRPP